MSSYVAKQIEELKKSQIELRDELDSIDCTHYSKYTDLLKKIAENESRISHFEKLINKPKKLTIQTA